MPLSLLLTQQLTILTEGVRKLDPWEGITDTFALVARRLRSVWLVRWFGTSVPVEGIDVRVAIANLDGLRSRYASVTAAARGAVGGGPNLTEPLLGAGGSIAGALAAPVNAMVVAVIAGGVLTSCWERVVAALGWVSGGGLMSALLLVATPLAAAGVVAQAVGGGAVDTYDVLGALAVMALPLQRLWDQLSGRAPLRNPLLLALVHLGDSLAALLAQVLGVVAVAVTRIAPLVRPAVGAARSSVHAVTAIVGGIRLALADITTFLRMFTTGPYAVTTVVASVARALRGLGRRLWLLVTTTLDTMARIALARVDLTLRAVTRYAVDAARLVVQVMVDTPFVHWLRAVRGLAAALGHWRDRPGPPPSTPSSPSVWRTSFPWPASVRALGAAFSATPPVSVPTASWPSLVGPGVIAPIARALAESWLPEPDNPFATTVAERAALRRFRTPPSTTLALRAFEERQGHRAEAARAEVFDLAGALAALGPRLERNIGLLAPAAATTLLPRIESFLDDLDLRLRRTPVAHPTADLPEPDTIRPVVGRFVIRAPGGSGVPGGTAAASPPDEHLRTFVATVREQLDARTYAVPRGAR